MYPKKKTTQTDRQSWQVSSAHSAENLIAFGRSRGWDFQILGKAPFPTAPFRRGDWLIVPAHLDTTPLPPCAKQRMEAIFAAGIRPQGFILVHEAPFLLTAGTQAETRQKPEPIQLPVNKQKVKKFLKASGGVLAVVAVASGAVILLAVALALLLPGLLLATALVIDPILVAVTSDGYWVEIDRWDLEV